MNNKKYIPYIIGAVIVVMGLYLITTYNGLVKKDEKVKVQWSEVQNAYQRRLDLIPNLVKTVKAYADFEKSTLQAVIEARAKATSINVSADNLDEATLAKINAQMSEVNSSLSRLLVTVERYPDLKANQGFLKLQDELAGTENRIAVARDNFNEVVKVYNNAAQRFPAVIFARLLGFKTKPYFESDKGAEKAPKVEF